LREIEDLRETLENTSKMKKSGEDRTNRRLREESPKKTGGFDGWN
jgi:hypothetical protein